MSSCINRPPRASAPAPSTAKHGALDLDALLDALADRIVAKLASRPTTPRHANGDHNPYGSERAFLDAARRGAFPTFRVSRKVTALWSDVEAAQEARATMTKRPATESEAALAELTSAGLRTVRARR